MATAVRPLRQTSELATMNPAEETAIDGALENFKRRGMARRLMVFRNHDDGYGDRPTLELSAEPGLPYTRTLTSVHELMKGPGVFYSGYQVGLDGCREASRSCIHRWCDD